MLSAAWIVVKVLLLLGVANSAPIAAKRWLGARGGWPLDGGLAFLDGQPLLGSSKTVRGLVAATLATALVAPLLAVPPWIGAAVGLLAMAGDALSSFVKRRLRIAPSGRATGLDQIPEALLPCLVLQEALQLTPVMVLAATALFFALEGPVARLSHRFGLRETPY